MDAHASERYCEKTRRLVARRGPLCVVLFAVGIGLGDIIEYHYHPERLSHLILFSSLELAICLGTIGLYRVPRLARSVIGVTRAACIGLLLCLSLYFCLTGANGSALAFVFIVFELTTALMFPWGARDQVPIALVCALFYGGYAVYTAPDVAGGNNTLPIVYGFYAVAAGGGLSVLGAAILDRQRFALFTERQQFHRHLETFRDLTLASEGLDPRRVLRLTCTSTLEVFALERLWAVWQAPGSGLVQGYFARRGRGGVVTEEFADPQLLWNVLSLPGCPTEPAVTLGGPGHRHVPASLRAANVKSVLFMPFRFENQNLGGMWADRNGEPFDLGQQELAMASVLAGGVAITVANAGLYQQATAASEEKSTFLARIAHELRNPLHTLLWDIDTLRRQAGGPDALLDRLRQNALMMLDVATELQEFAEVETKRMKACREPVNLVPMFEELRATAVALFGKRPIAFRAHVEAGAEVIVTDALRLRQVLNNLLSNAAKFTMSGTIEVRAQRGGSDVTISVRDTGVGIKGKELTTIFAPFYRGSVTTGVPTRGMGLGLAIAQEITSLLGGRIEVESEVGRGSTFRLRLPAGDATAHEALRRERSVTGSSAEILLIEDDDRCRAQMAHILEHAGARIIEASDGAEGLRRAREHVPDVIVLDVGLPRVGGVEVLTRLKRDRRLAAVPVVVATGDPDRQLEVRCREAGCAAYLVKDNASEALLRAVMPLVSPH